MQAQSFSIDTSEPCPTEPEISEIEALAFVGEDRVNQVGMTDDEREDASRRAGVAMHAWFARWKATGDRAALRIAHRHLTQMLAIVHMGKGRDVA